MMSSVGRIGLALLLFTAAALAAGLGKIEGTVPATFTGDLYLLLTTIIASLLIDAKRRDALAEAHRNELLSRKLLEVQDQERRELSQWLHDEPLQLLVAARMELGAVKAGRSGAEERLGRRIKEAESTIRKAAFDLSPYALEELGLCEAIRLLAEDEGGQAGIEVSMDCEALEPHPQQDHAYFAIARELISNAVRHAQASKVCVSLRRDGSGIAMLVRDDGIGIAEEKRLDALKNGHLGLVSARERAAAVGCELRVERPADGGTCVSIRPRD